ncbi:MAG: hypothetical protein CSA36_00315 [Draconibacterium sp.]|nr:MAG: hypothetical protein CSA36_00315 [Draconibacterium sp.]
MKTIKIFALLLLAGVLVSSCKKKEEGTPRQMINKYEYTGGIRGTEDVSGTYTLPTLNLSTVIGVTPAENLTSAELQNADCYFIIEGLSALETSLETPVVLEDFKVTVGGGAPISLGDCKVNPSTANEFASDTKLSTKKFLDVSTAVFNSLKSSSRSATVSVSFKPSVKIEPSDNVNLKIGFGGVYTYLEYQN